MNVGHVASLIRNIPDYPKPGIQFKDITPVLRDGGALSDVVDGFAEWTGATGATVVAAIEARGFIFGAAVASRLGLGLVPVRKSGKLPWRTVAAAYDLEYGSNTLELHEDALGSSDRVVIIDDLLATGGTAAATVELCRGLGATVLGCGFLVELTFLDGRSRLQGLDVFAPVRY